MKTLLRCCILTSVMAALALPVGVRADEAESYDKDAEYAEGNPPMIPHHVKDTADGEYCLSCHGTGVNGAPLSPHPVRLICTGCHAQGEIKESKPAKKHHKKK